MTQEQDRAVTEYERIRAKLGKINGKNGAGIEAQYTQAYQRLVSLGLKPPLRERYR